LAIKVSSLESKGVNSAMVTRSSDRDIISNLYIHKIDKLDAARAAAVSHSNQQKPFQDFLKLSSPFLINDFALSHLEVFRPGFLLFLSSEREGG
jgi:hypothetical protein